MANREIVVRLRAEAGDFRRTFAAAQKDAQGLDTALGRTSRNADASVSRMGGSFARLSTSIRANRDSWDSLGSKAMIGGAAVGVGLGLATKAAIDWESAWAGVTKTIDASPEQFAELEQGLRGLAKTLPATHEEIAGVAEAAGQLGIARQDILGFTETAIALGESTNLSAAEAAEGLAKISNVMGTSAREGVEGYEKLGNVLVALGNDGASTERDIVSMAQRLTGASKLAGITEGELLALANAMSSVGIESELGGGAMSRAILTMHSSVRSGDAALDSFAQTALGATASGEDFARLWANDPVEAIRLFTVGLGNINESGGDVKTVLKETNLAGTQNAQVLLRLAGASDVLTDSLELQGTEWANGTALQDEATKRYETTASRLQIAQNTMKDAAIDIGSVAGPVLASAAEKVAGVANAFVQLPEPAKNATTAILGIVAAGGVLSGATVKVVGWAQDFGDALETVGIKGPKVEAGLTKVGKAAKFAGAALAVAAATGKGIELFQGLDGADSIGIEKLTRQMLDGADAVGVLDKQLQESSVWLGSVTPRVDSFGRALEVAFDPDLMNSWQGKADAAVTAFSLGTINLTSDADEAAKAFRTVDEQLTQLVTSGRQDIAGDLFDRYAAAAKDAGVSTDELKGKLPGYTEALASAENQADLTGAAASGMAGDFDEVAVAADDTEKKIEDLAKAIEGLGGGFRSERGAAREVRDALTEIGEAAKGSADDQEAALDDLAQSQLDHIAIMARNGKDSDALASATRRARAEFISAANSLGIYGKAASDLADKQGLIDDDVTLFYESMGIDTAKQKVTDLKAAQDALPKSLQTSVTVPGAVDSRSKTQAFYDSLVRLPGSKQTSVSAPGAPGAKGQVDEVTGSVFRLPTSKTVTVTANTGAAMAALAGVGAYMAAIQSKTVTVTTQQRTVGGRADGGLDEFRGGRHIQAMANGGTWDPNRPWDTTLGRMQPGIKPVTSRGILMAEEGAGPWEAFISGHPAKLERSRAIWLETGKKLGLIEAFANGGVYGDWQAELRNVKRMKGQYRRTIRFEDGSSKYEDPLQIFEDGTARWAGFYAAPAGVASAIARLNAAQDRYEDAKRQPKGQHSAAYYEKKRQQQENARNRYDGKHSAEYYETKRRQQENARRRGQSSGGSGKVTGPRKLKMLGPEVGGGDGIGLPKLGSYRYPGRDASTRSVSSQNWIPGRTSAGGAGFSEASITRAIENGMRGWKPSVVIDGRTIYGVMQRVTTERGRR